MYKLKRKKKSFKPTPKCQIIFYLWFKNWNGNTNYYHFIIFKFLLVIYFYLNIHLLIHKLSSNQISKKLFLDYQLRLYKYNLSWFVLASLPFITKISFYRFFKLAQQNLHILIDYYALTKTKRSKQNLFC